MDALLIAVVTGGISSVATVAAIKVDIGWIKQTQVEFKIQLEKFEQRMNALEKGE
ncbi:hypothetical protein [Vibrio harveyi]|uniref:hypothetical protein n=1 Tax=Vibrio harveyi TaxID=669 RepID=UPI000B284FF1|nr:hypothetical protein [Vibrio harveyi]ELI0636755.1 hypothetical protein [Vibrio harveyi]